MNWEQRYRTGDTPWEKGAAAPPLVEWLGSRGAMRGAVLAAASPSAQVVGLDISPYAIDQGRLHPPAGMETYQLADLFHLPPELTNRFAWVFEHTCFCANPPRHREDYVRAFLCALESRGILLATFFLNPWDPGEEAPEGGGPPFAMTREELDVLFATDFELVEE